MREVRKFSLEVEFQGDTKDMEGVVEGFRQEFIFKMLEWQYQIVDDAWWRYVQVKGVKIEPIDEGRAG